MAFPPSPHQPNFLTNPGSFEFERTIDAIDFRKDPRAVLPGEILSSAVGGRLPSDTPRKINMEPPNHPFRKENDLPNLHDSVPC